MTGPPRHDIDIDSDNFTKYHLKFIVLVLAIVLHYSDYSKGL